MFLINLTSLYRYIFSATYFLEVGARVSMLKLRFLHYFSKAKTGDCGQQDCSFSDNLGLLALAELLNIWKWMHPFHSKQPPQLRWGVKKFWKSTFLGCFSKAKTEECHQKKLSLSGKFGMLMSGLDTYFLEVNADALLKVTTKTSFRCKKSENSAFLGYFSEVKTEEYD